MRNGDVDQQRQARRGEILYIAACAAVFLVIAACAAYFVIKLLA
jgi:heme/copper-type cytochrome/quinol oxidase subunit 2